MYVNYSSALEMTNLTTLAERREKRCLDLVFKTSQKLQYVSNKNSKENEHFIRKREKFEVNFANSQAYQAYLPYHIARDY